MIPNSLDVVTQRSVDRPGSAGPPMPVDLRLPKLAFPDAEHAGTPLSRLREPHALGTPGADRDMQVARELIAQRTPIGDAWARALDHHGGTVVWREFVGNVPGDPSVNQTVLGAALSAASHHAGIGKRQWNRQRPFQVDPSIHVIGRTPRAIDSSYPSGHAARAFAGARIVATLDPSLADAAYAMAREVAMARIYAGVHFPSDVIAGARLGIAAAESTLDRWRRGELDLSAA